MKERPGAEGASTPTQEESVGDGETEAAGPAT